MLQENLLSLIREKCASDWELTVFQDHIIVNLANSETDFRMACQQVKRQVSACIKENFPDREQDILFEVRSGAWNSSFKLPKTAPILKTDLPLSEKDEQYKAMANAKTPVEQARKKWDQLKKK